MSTLQPLRENFGQTWEGLTAGWRQLVDRASEALTRFTPSPQQKDSVPSIVSSRSSRWGVIAAEVLDEDNRVIVRLEAPGMNASDFDISVRDDVLVVRGEKKYRREQSKGHYHLLECAYGRFERALSLPASVDEGNTDAAYEQGVLTITLQKKTGSTRKRIPVKTA